jgi:hypothetical protein
MKQLQWGKTADKRMSWQEAVDYCKSLGKGWRLPTRIELIDAYDSKVDGFETDDYYWSSTTYVGSTGYAWSVYFGYGSVYSSYKAYNYYVRPVRGGQCIGNLKIKKSEIKSEAVKLLKKMIERLR